MQSLEQNGGVVQQVVQHLRTARRRRERVATRLLASCAKRASMTGETRPSIISDSSVPRFLMPSTCVRDAHGPTCTLCGLWTHVRDGYAYPVDEALPRGGIWHLPWGRFHDTRAYSDIR